MSNHDDIRRFTLLNEEVKVWHYLQQANQMHLTAGQKHLQAFHVCRDAGVAFTSIQEYCLNQAKKAGLLQKNHVNGNGKSVYPPMSVLKQQKPAWFLCMQRFISWVNRNYVGYDKAKEKKQTVRKTSEKVSKNVTVTESVKPDGTVERKTTVSQGSDITSPVTEELDVAQITSIITANFEVLGQFCKEKGAEEEFKALMDKINA